MSGTHAISTTSRRELSSSVFLLQGKAPKEIHAILTETLTCFLPGWAKDLSATLYINHLFGGGALQPPVDQGLLNYEVSRSHSTTHHSRSGPSGRVISPSQKPLPDNTQQSQQTDIHASGRIRTHALERAATGTGR